jgi:hypothetical protein
LHAQCSDRRIGENGWLEKVSGTRQPLASTQQTRPAADGVFDVFSGLRNRFIINESPDL